MDKLKDKVAIITGATSGMGKAAAILFAGEGARVVAADIMSEGSEDLINTIKSAGNEAIFIQADVSSSADVRNMIEAAVDTYGKVDILYNNAGIAGPVINMVDTPEEEWDKVIDINLKGVFLGMKHVIPEMLKRGGGVIINTGSSHGVVGAPNFSAYAASKSGVINLTKTGALEFARQNIRVNCICPGVTATPMKDYIKAHFPHVPGSNVDYNASIPMHRPGNPEEIVKVALFLASDDSSYMTGAAVLVDGGFTAI